MNFVVDDDDLIVLLLVLVVQWLGVGLVIERSLVRLPAGKSPRSTQLCIPPR